MAIDDQALDNLSLPTAPTTRPGDSQLAKPKVATGDGPAAPLYESVESAAEKLGLSDAALRARCRRGARRDGDAVVASLGGGITAFKFGRTWRFVFPKRS